MGPDDHDGDEARRDPLAGGPPPKPADRPWVHPSELQSFVATPAATSLDGPAGPAGPGSGRVRPREWAVGLGSAVAASVVTVLVLVAFGALGRGSQPPAPQPAFIGAASGVDYSIARRIARSTAPSVVTLRVAGADTPVGSGVALSSDRVVTNAHLVQGADTIRVVTADGRDYVAKVLGRDPQTDLAVLTVADGDLSAVAQGDGRDLGVGSAVVAVAANRSGGYRTDIDVIADENRLVDTGSGALVAGALETGIPAGGAWAGGALVDAAGNLVGILTNATGAPGTGLLAVPVAAVREVRTQLEASGSVSHGWLGVVFGDDAVERSRGGARVATVVPGSPAATGGLVAGDIVTGVGERSVRGRADAIAAVRALRPQDPVQIGMVDPAGRARQLKVTLATPDAAVILAFPTSG